MLVCVLVCVLVWGPHFGERVDPDGRGIELLAETRNAFADLEGLQLHFVQVHDFTGLAEADSMSRAGERFLGCLGWRECDVPKVRLGMKNMDGVNKVVRRFLVEFCDDTGGGALPLFTVQGAAQMQFLVGRKPIVQANAAAIAAHKQRIGNG